MYSVRTERAGSRHACLRTARLAAVAILIAAIPALPALADYPVIRALGNDDPLFRQHQHDVRDYYRRASAGSDLPPLLFYRYRVDPDDTIFGIAARFSLPYSAIATLNRLPSPLLEGVTSLLIPGIPGIFVPLTPESDLELVMHDLRRDRSARVVTIAATGGPQAFRFFPGEDYLPEERRGFLGVLFRHPLPDSILTSPFGPRVNPITQQWSFHGGVDYAAPAGTRVLAARTGTVSSTGYDPILGTYVVLDHSGGFQTVYGHLQSVAVSLNQEVRSGMMLGAVGSTGMVTGSHLHFEIRQSGRARDPQRMLP